MRRIDNNGHTLCKIPNRQLFSGWHCLMLTLCFACTLGMSRKQCGHTAVVELRGGDSDNEGANEANDSTVLVNPPPKRKWWHLFQIRNEAQAEACREPFGGTPTSTTSSRGGALVKQKVARRRGFSWMSERSMVIPQQTMESVRKVWWVNAWTDQLPSEEDERKELELRAEMESRRKELELRAEIEARVIAEVSVEAEETVEVESKESVLKEDDEQAPEIEKREPRNRKRRKKNSIEKSSQRDASPVDTTEEQSADAEHTSSLENEVTFPLKIPLPSAMKHSTEYRSAGHWSTIDQLCSLGLSRTSPNLSVSSYLRPVRKIAARATGLHGFVSGKPKASARGDDQLRLVRLGAIKTAKEQLEVPQSNSESVLQNLFPWGKPQSKRRPAAGYEFVLQKALQDEFAEKSRQQRLKNIEDEMEQAQKRLAVLACEKDVLQRSHNPLWKYAVDDPSHVKITNATTTRFFNFPSDDLVVEYLDMLFASGRLVSLNHTDLWRNSNNEDLDDLDEDDFFGQIPADGKRRGEDVGASGSWLLRNGLGEKIGVTTEKAAYKAVCKALMSVLARSLSSLHGLTIMTYSDVRITMEQTPSLPPLAGHIPGSDMNRNYAHDTFNDVMRRGSRSNRSRRPKDDFIQKAAVVETLLSQCQIAAPIMKLFPLAWQRAMLGNIISMVTALISDFCEGIEFQLLGHRLSILFTPITEEDMVRSMHSANFSNQKRRDTEKFEAAVLATAEDVGEGLKFLDRWHERALGGGVLRTQIATLIARLVLTLVDDILSASKMDLWASQAGGPRLVSGLEYRSIPGSVQEQ